MTVVFTITFGLLSAAGVLAILRLAKGPRTLDRILALDVLLVLIVAGVAVGIASSLKGFNIALLITVALLAFVGSIAAIRLVERWEEYR
ncbi:multisubunit sodium/proton antiporter, MrpF subunit [Amycolatopsis marina]|uniref:Multisubunit sodium/proton antiporter, MrpF subunit n=1 Tax=Amycolatopsis marina TaxID=490629 RepID=A0A1I0ZC14_9PSEU|nr:monovalent cation/H+ antiporter complex subunit F [Amycolatopsis marina]SFB23309.1 multisubunit sodium/proton antiporter, MrpF subunit [Amycolatopsis marina]